MKATQKRVWSILLALMMLVSILGSVIVLPVQAATVDYVYSGNYIYNWGQREQLATFLSPNAIKFYEDNKVNYDDLSNLSGSSSTTGAQNSDLYNELQDLMESNHDYETTYEATKTLFQYTDCQNGGGKISSFYSGESVGPGWTYPEWNREHTWPNSKGDDAGNGENDIMMLRPTASSENSSRGNKAYGNTTTTTYYNPNQEGGGKYDLRGDVARIILYQHVRWGAASLFGADGVIESKDVMLDWLEQDPVDTWELGRNDSVEAITGTRNVFVDYPELAFLLFNEDIPAGYDSPSGEGAGPAYTITASTNNSTYGTVSLSGKTITAIPKTGYEATGYTILSGTATVKRNGNVFTVSPSSNVSVRINFAKREERTVQFVQAGGVISTQTAYSGDDIDLPAHSGAVPEGYTFLGWSEQNVEETEIAPTYWTEGSSYNVSAEAILYALYSRFDSEVSGNINSFEPYSGTLTEGDYIIVYKDGAMKAEVSSDRLTFDTVSTDAGSIDNPAAAIVWHIAKDGNNWTIYNTSAGVYAAGNGTKNKAALVTSVTDFAKWTATGDGTYEFVNVGNKAKSVNANLRRNGTYGYACYSTSTGGALTLYKRASGTLYYVTADKAACLHEYDNACDATCNLCGSTRVPSDHNYKTVVTAPNCVDGGYTTYTCTACGDSYVANATAALGHNYDAEVTDPDCENGGYTTHTCSRCGDSYVDNYTTAIGHKYVSTVTKPATCGADGVKTYACANCGDSYTESISATGAHTYGHDYDVNCNVCGGIREVTLPVSFGGNSVSEDVNGLAFRFDMAVSGMAMNATTAIYDNATVGGYKLIKMGAVMTNNDAVGSSAESLVLESVNDDNVLNINAKYLMECNADACSFAVRIVGIPAAYAERLIYARPYFVFEYEGKEITVYGSIYSATYA